MIFLGMRSELIVGVAVSKSFLQGLKPAESRPFAWELKLPPPKEAELRPRRLFSPDIKICVKALANSDNPSLRRPGLQPRRKRGPIKGALAPEGSL